MSITQEDVKAKRETVAALREQITAEQVARSEINAGVERVIEVQKLDAEIARLQSALNEERAITRSAEENAAKVEAELVPAPITVEPVVDVEPVVENQAPVVEEPPAAPKTLAQQAQRTSKNDSTKSSDSDKGI